MRFITASRFRKWLMIYTVILLVIADCFLALAWLPNSFTHYTIFWLVINFDTLRYQLACIILPVSTVVLFILIFVPRTDPTIHLLIAITILAANVIACCARIPGFDFRIEEQDSVVVSPYVYHALSTSQLAMNNNIYISLYECDRYDFLCRVVFEQTVSSRKAKLLADRAARTITLQINGEVVYMHPVK